MELLFCIMHFSKAHECFGPGKSDVRVQTADLGKVCNFAKRKSRQFLFV